MAPVLEPRLLWQELLCCAGLGLAAGTVRSLFAAKGRAAWGPDFLLVSGLLLLLQSYAAGFSYAGVLRWYMTASAAAGAGLAQAAWADSLCLLAQGTAALLFWPLRAVGRALAAPFWGLCRIQKSWVRSAQKKQEILKNSLPKQSALLYNSNEEQMASAVLPARPIQRRRRSAE